jgi:hypothetical protein
MRGRGMIFALTLLAGMSVAVVLRLSQIAHVNDDMYVFASMMKH